MHLEAVVEIGVGNVYSKILGFVMSVETPDVGNVVIPITPVLILTNPKFNVVEAGVPANA